MSGDGYYSWKRLKMPNTMLNGWDLRIPTYEAGTAEEIIPRWYQEGYRANVVIVDPPQNGLGYKINRDLVALCT